MALEAGVEGDGGRLAAEALGLMAVEEDEDEEEEDEVLRNEATVRPLIIDPSGPSCFFIFTAVTPSDHKTCILLLHAAALFDELHSH